MAQVDPSAEDLSLPHFMYRWWLLENESVVMRRFGSTEVDENK